MTAHSKVLVLTINSASSIPVLHHLLGELAKTHDVEVIECDIVGYPDLPKPVTIRPIVRFETAQEYNNQSFGFKLRKYSTVLTRGLLAKIREKNVILYVIDWQILTLLIPLNPFLKAHGWKIVYHQFELSESLPPAFRGPLAPQIDLAIFPEIHRKNYFFERYNRSNIKKHLVLPNTCPLPGQSTELPTLATEGRRVIGHIGNIGPRHFLDTLISLIEILPQDEFFFLIIGGTSPEVEERLAPYADYENVCRLGHLSHEQLGQFYRLIDIGLILYRGLDLNFEYCAPNKLYEYWSYGIQVLAHQLTGLNPIFQNDTQGKLFDLEDPAAVSHATDWLSSTDLDKHQTTQYFDRHYSLPHYLAQYVETIAELTH